MSNFRFKILDLRFIAVLLCALMLIACEKPQEDPKRDESLVLTATQDTVVCNLRMGDMAALQLTWTAGTNHGTGSALAYTIDMNRADSDMTKGVHFDIGRTMDRTFSLTHRQLVDSILPLFAGVKDNEPVDFALRVRAKIVMTGEEQVSKIVPMPIIRYLADTTHLYPVGSAMPNGWDKDHAAEMQWDMNTLTGYTWTGKLHKGEFKILTSTEEWLPCFVRDSEDATHMVYRATDEDYPDNKWDIDVPGSYTIGVDTKSRTIVITLIEQTERYEHIYMIGDAAPGGWSWDNLTEMTHPEKDLFIYEGPLNAGQIKFPTEIKSDWSGEMIYAPTPDCDASENGTFAIHTGDPDNKWVIPAAGNWSITINIQDTTISFKQL